MPKPRHEQQRKRVTLTDEQGKIWQYEHKELLGPEGTYLLRQVGYLDPTWGYPTDSRVPGPWTAVPEQEVPEHIKQQLKERA